MKKNFVLWLTGLAAAGKTTLGAELTTKLNGLGLKTYHLDGDEVRKFFPQLGFTINERNENVLRAGFAASVLEKNGVNSVVSFISPVLETRAVVRNLCENFVEIYLSTPLAVCEMRDPKGLYLKARKGLIKDFTGIDSTYEAPLKPEIMIDTSETGVSEAVLKIFNYLEQKSLI